MKFFKPEDFIKELDQRPISWPWAWQEMCDVANAKLEREGEVVYENMLQNSMRTEWSCKHTRNTVNKALLINIEPFEKCKHPAEKVESYYAEACRPETKYFKCECGAKVKPKEFEEVE